MGVHHRETSGLPRTVHSECCPGDSEDNPEEANQEGRHTHGFHASVHLTLHASHRITSHRITLHLLTSHRITLHLITSHRITLHLIASHRITLHLIASHCITLHHIASHHIASHCISSHHIASHHIASHCISSHHITSHGIILCDQGCHQHAQYIHAEHRLHLSLLGIQFYPLVLISSSAEWVFTKPATVARHILADM